MIAIIDYGIGNLTSISNAFKALNGNAVVTSDPDLILKADALVLPGVGAFADGMKNLHNMNLTGVLNDMVIKRKIPFLGICLGMQLLAEISYEYGETGGLGWIKGKIDKIKFVESVYKVPHIGWNDVHLKADDFVLFQGLGKSSTFYFVHSYYFIPDKSEEDCIAGITHYSTDMVTMVQKNHIFGVQFHPEKSQGAGLTLLNNFINYIKTNG